MKLDDVRKMPITEYRDAIDEAINLGNWSNGGEFKLQTKEEDDLQLKAEYEKAKSQGKING